MEVTAKDVIGTAKMHTQIANTQMADWLQDPSYMPSEENVREVVESLTLALADAVLAAHLLQMEDPVTYWNSW